ncbi:MAG: hypothetical protein AAF125_22020 [Chloroflexota bacterium]
MRRAVIPLMILIVLIPIFPTTAQDVPPAVQIALDDLNIRLDTALTFTTDGFEWDWEEVVFDDMMADCRAIDTPYEALGISGYTVEFVAQRRVYRYHTSTDGDILAVCGAVAPAVDGVPRPVTDALADLSSRVGFTLTPSSIPWRWRETTYPTDALGCRLPGVDYEGPEVQAYVVSLTLQGVIHEYRISSDRQILVYCNPRQDDAPEE